MKKHLRNIDEVSTEKIFMAKYVFKEDDIRQHLMMQQDIINRMANNSSNCKAWLITIVAALTALQITQETIHNFGWLMIIICLMFWYLDAFYLALERLHRDNERYFVSELKKENFSIEELIYCFSTKGNDKLMLTLKAMWSTSCFPFYIILIGLTVFLSWTGIHLDR